MCYVPVMAKIQNAISIVLVRKYTLFFEIMQE